jgi:hypothetical protein
MWPLKEICCPENIYDPGNINGFKDERQTKRKKLFILNIISQSSEFAWQK